MKSGIVHKYDREIVPCCFYCRIYGYWCTWLLVASEEFVLQVGVNTDETE